MFHHLSVALMSSCAFMVQNSGNKCPTTCQQALASLTEECKTELNTLAQQQNITTLSDLCGVTGASVTLSPVRIVTAAVALAIGHLLF